MNMYSPHYIVRSLSVVYTEHGIPVEKMVIWQCRVLHHGYSTCI